MKLAVSLICLLVLYWPLIDVRYYYLDDIGRASEGYGWYINAGRPLNDVLLSFVTHGGLLTDISPAPQLLGVLALAATATLLATWLQIGSPLWVAVFAVAVGGSPYFLENMSFRFDSGFMALGVLCATAPYWLRGIGQHPPLVVSSVLLFASLCLYQPTVNCYGVVGLYLMAQWAVYRPVSEVAVSGLRVAAPLVIAVLAYWSLWQILPGWVAGHLQEHRFSSIDTAFSTAATNLGMYADTVVRHWGSTGLGWIWMLMVAATVVMMAWRAGTAPGRSPAAKVAAAALVIALLALTFPAAFLSQIFLMTPVHASRAFAGVIALIAIFSAALLSVRPGPMSYLTKGLVLLQALGLVGLIYTYANALRMQERYNDRVTTAIVNDILELEPSGKVWTFAISGWMGRSPPVDLALAKYPALEGLVFSVIHEQSYWAAARFKMFGLWVKPAPEGQIDKVELICNGTPQKSNARYDLYLVEQTVLIRFKNDGVECS